MSDELDAEGDDPATPATPEGTDLVLRNLMTGEEKTFDKGFIGFGSFDDTGKVTNIKVWGKSVETKETPAFPPAVEAVCVPWPS